VTLTAEGNAYSDFTGWSAPCSGSSRTCLVTMDEGTLVTATFTARYIGAAVFARWLVEGRRTTVQRLVAGDVPRNASVVVVCDGDGCAFSRRTAKQPGTVDETVGLKALFEGRALRPGTVIEIRITAPDSIGKLLRFTTRRAQLPRREVLCLPPGVREPKAC
ncbi:MAG: InlB B-repeat-containing protein, partial [Actinomycetota bacterium]